MSTLVIESWGDSPFDGTTPPPNKFERFSNVVQVAPFGEIGIAVVQRQPNGKLATKVIMDTMSIRALYIEETDEDSADLGPESRAPEAQANEGPRVITNARQEGS